MKKNFQIIGVLTLICFSFFCTEKTVHVIKNTDEIMQKIKDESEKYNTKYIDALIVKDTMIPGLSGLSVDEEKSYEKMKRLGKYDPSLYMYNEEKPSISIYDNYDKYIIKGNSKKRNVSIIFYGKLKQLKEIHNLLSSNSIKGSYLLEDITEYNKFSSYIDEEFDFVINKKTNDKNSDMKIYCYNKDNDSDFLNYCALNKYFSVQPSLIVENDLYIKVKQNLDSGLIILLNVNDKTIYELPSVINYLKSKGYELTNLTELISE